MRPAAVAKTVHEKVEQPAGLIALFGLSRDQGNAADAEHDVGRIDIASELSLCRAAFSREAMASSRLSGLSANGLPPDAITLRRALAGSYRRLDVLTEPNKQAPTRTAQTATRTARGIFAGIPRDYERGIRPDNWPLSSQNSCGRRRI